MRNKFQALVLSGVLTLAAGAGYAQSGPPNTPPPPGEGEMHHRGPMSTEDQLAHLTKALNLTADQQAQIKPILDSRREQQMQLHQDDSISRDDKMAKMKTIDQDSHAKITAILNEDQKAKFAKMMDRQEQHGYGMHQGPPPPPQQ